MVVILSKVTMNPELVSPEPVLLGEIDLGSCEPLATTV